MSDLGTAIAIAAAAHKGQVDKAARPYILHPLRLMFACHTDTEKIIAVLHDVVEDSETTLDDLKAMGFAAEIIDALTCLTKQPGEDYDAFISRILPNALARKVKIEDIKDNLDLTRLEKLTPKDVARIEKYHRALLTLSARQVD